jgi:hypothetical protein
VDQFATYSAMVGTAGAIIGVVMGGSGSIVEANTFVVSGTDERLSLSFAQARGGEDWRVAVAAPR